jgi:multidrug resistance efflux pump
MSAEFRLQREGRTESANGITEDNAAETTEANALARLARLNESLRAQPVPSQLPAELPKNDATRGGRRWALPFGRIAKSLLALALAVALAWLPVQRLLATTSTQAAINARLVNMRAPIDGKVSILASTIAVGTLVAPGEPLLQLSNTRADRGPLDTLRRSVSELQFESTALKDRLAQLQVIQADLGAQRDAFQQGRIRQLEARAGELAADVTAARAAQQDAVKSLKRSDDMNAAGHQTLATLLHADRDLKVANAKIETANHRLEGNKIELEGARQGLFIGDSYNDLPRSAQRFSEIAQQIGDLRSQLGERAARSGYLEKEFASQTDAFARKGNVDVTATIRGRIWEVLTANGEEAQTGQTLLRILDCDSAVVTATISESVYNKLWIGQSANFIPRGESQELAGTVVALTGLAVARSNFAIDQAGLAGEPYHVTIAVPDLATNGACNVGRTGGVTFNTSGEPRRGFVASVERAIRYLKPAFGFP